MMTYTLKVLEIRKETHDTHTICFRQPALRKIKYRPGQYLTLIVNVNGRKFRRPYSFSSCPGIDSTLNITVKRVSQGMVSNHLIDIVKEGDLVEVIEPMGDFVYPLEDENQNKEVFLWGAGSGITPLMSILKFVLNEHTKSKVTLVYYNRNKEQTIFYDDLTKLKQQYADRFSLYLFYTKGKDGNGNLNGAGRIDKAEVKEILKATDDFKNTLQFICGPEGLKDTVKTTLLKNDIDPKNIFIEDFEHIVNETQLGEIQTRSVELIRNDETITLEVVRGKSILEAGLDRQMDLSYSCQTGTCTLCKGKLVSGEIKLIGLEKTPQELQTNEILLCCSYPLTENIRIEIE